MQAKNLIVFDIDGTLTDTHHADADLFFKAICENLEITNLIKTWENYKYSTDSGFLLEICEQHLKRPPTAEENKKIQTYFHTSLKKYFNELTCQPIAGAQEIFSYIHTLGNWNIAIATGAWNESALIKLTTAKIPHTNIPLATSSEHIERSEIIKIAIERAKEIYQIQNYNHVIYVGDRKWDLLAAKTLNIGFIGIGENIKNVIHELHPELTNNVISHYLDWKSFITKLEQPDKLKISLNHSN